MFLVRNYTRKGQIILVGNLYRPPNSRLEYNDRFKDFMDKVSNEGKEIILTGDFNKNLCTDHFDTYWLNFTLSLDLSQLICQHTRVTSNSRSLIDHIYTNIEDKISSVNVCKLTISDHYTIFGNRRLNISERKNAHQAITYGYFKHFDVDAFRSEWFDVPWEIIENFTNVNDMVQVWNSLFLEIVNNKLL